MTLLNFCLSSICIHLHQLFLFLFVSQAVMRRNDVMLSGSDKPGARFGSAIELAGDLNRDKYMGR